MGRASKYMPAVGSFGHKWYPEDIAGTLGLPYVGHVFYVDSYAGSDSASGKTHSTALKTVAAAYAKCTSGQHDVVMIAPTGGTGRTTETAAIVWAKRFTHLVGSCAPIQTAPRAGMTFSSAVVTPMFTVSENGCIFKNITMTCSSDIDVMMLVTGDYNYFEGCHIQGTTNATTGAGTAWRAIVMDGANENLFVGCTIGVDTFVRSGVNISLEQTGVCAENIYRSCLFVIYSDDGLENFVKITNNDAAQRFVIFEDCLFHNGQVGGGSTVIAVAMNLFSNLLNGTVLLKNSHAVGVTAWANNYSCLFTTTPLPVGAEAGMALVVSG